MHWSEVWESDSQNARRARSLLTPLSWLYSGGWHAYSALYKYSVLKPSEPHWPVVCVGSLTVGGSGKTPAALHIADVLSDLGHQVVVSCSGYGSPASEAAQIAKAGDLNAAQWGDEPSMIRWLRPALKLIVGRRRVLAAQLCHRVFPRAVLVLDDGFQHLPLKKHVGILLEDPAGNNLKTLPAGPYREPRAFKERADLVIPNGFRIVPEPLSFLNAEGEKTAFAPCKIRALCALGQPSNFFETLEGAGFEIVERQSLPDHATLGAGNLFGDWPSDEPVVVTAKDWVKLRERPDVAGRKILIADHRVVIEPRNDFSLWIENKLNECAQNA